MEPVKQKQIREFAKVVPLDQTQLDGPISKANKHSKTSRDSDEAVVITDVETSNQILEEKTSHLKEGSDAKVHPINHEPARQQIKRMNTTTRVAQIFNLYDKDNSGTLSRDEMRAALSREVGGEFTTEEFERMMQNSDKDGSGNLDMDEFLRLLKMHQNLKHQKIKRRVSNSGEDGGKKDYKSHHSACSALNMVFRVRFKWMLALGCHLICILATALLGIAFDGMHPNDFVYGLIRGLYWVFIPVVILLHWVVAFPKRYRMVWLVIVGFIGVLCSVPYALSFSCDGCVFMLLTQHDFMAGTIWKIWYCAAYVLLMMFASLACIMFHGPIRSKCVLAMSIILSFYIAQNNTLKALDISPIFGLIHAFLGFVYLFCIMGFGGHTCLKQPKSVHGGWRSFICLVSFSVPTLSPSLIAVFGGLASAVPNEWARTIMWLIWKFMSFGLVNFFAKAMCYSFPTDVLALVMTFGQIFALQCGSELLFMDVNPLSVQFAVMMLLKAFLNIAGKGGLMRLINAKMNRSLQKEKGKKVTSCCVSMLQCIYKSVMCVTKIFMSNAGGNLMHNTEPDQEEYVLKTHIMNLLYVEMSLLSSVVSSIACATCVATELLLGHFFPNTFHHRVWTFQSDTPQYILGGYLFLVFWNIAISLVVSWLLERELSTLDVLSHLKMGMNHVTGGTVFDRVQVVTSKIKMAHSRRFAGASDLGKTNQVHHTKQLEILSWKLILHDFHQSVGKLHLFEQLVFSRHRKLMYFTCFFLAYAIVTWFAGSRYRSFLGKCNLLTDFEGLNDVLTGVVVPEDPECWFYDHNITNFTAVNSTNFTAVNASDVFMAPNLITTVQQFTISFNSIWR